MFDETLALFAAVDVVVHAAPCSARVLASEAARRLGGEGAFVDLSGSRAPLTDMLAFLNRPGDPGQIGEMR